MFAATGSSIMARARVAATQLGGDANLSPVIDNLGGIRVLLNNAIRDLYRSKAQEQKFVRDIYTRSTVAVAAGVGACPDTVMREFLHLSEFQDDNDSLITYYNYNLDADSGTTYSQLGYVVLQDDNFHYRAPAPDLDTYTGNLFVTAPSFPTFPVAMTSPINFPSSATVDDLVATLAALLIGGKKS